MTVSPRRRPAAEALSAFVAAASAAYAAGHAPSALALYGAEFGSDSARGRDGPRLTAAEASFRPLWLATVYETLRQRGAPTRAPPGEPASAELSHRVASVLAGGARTPLDPALRAGLAALQRSRRANAEGAHSPQRRGDGDDGGSALHGGVGSCLPPQAVPVSQLVLMTCQVRSSVSRVAPWHAKTGLPLLMRAFCHALTRAARRTRAQLASQACAAADGGE